jgi:hypothetical protein
MSRPGVPGSRPSFGANLGSITNHQSGILVPGAPAFRAFCEGWGMSLSSSPQLYSSRICRGAPGSRPSFGATSDQSSITNHQSGILVPGAPASRPSFGANLGSIINQKSSIKNLSAGCPSLSRCCEGWGCQPAERLTTLGYIPASSRFLAVHHDSTSTTPCSPMA